MAVAVAMGYVGQNQGSFSPQRDAAATEAQRTYALFMHLAGLLGFVSVPVVPTLIMWAIKKGESPYLDDHGREAMNAQLSYIIYALGLGALAPITCGITIPLLIALPVAAIIFTIVAATRANRGEYHRYPITLRMIH